MLFIPILYIGDDPYVVQCCSSLFDTALLTIMLYSAVHPYFVHRCWLLCCTMLFILILYRAVDPYVTSTVLFILILYSTAGPYHVKRRWPFLRTVMLNRILYNFFSVRLSLFLSVCLFPFSCFVCFGNVLGMILDHTIVHVQPNLFHVLKMP